LNILNYVKIKPINIDITFLYYNHNFLNKYNKRIPTTWNELFETGKYILEEEKKLNNTEIVIYNGLFSSMFMNNY